MPDYAFDMLMATVDAMLACRDFSIWSPVVAGWSQWAAYASEMI